MNFLTRPSTIIATLLIIASGAVNADCITNRKGDSICGKGRCLLDRYGAGYCSSFHKGGISRTSNGEIVCGRGLCIKTRYGEVFCSTEPEGSAGKDRYGVPRCQGQCELATIDYCESIPAGR